MLLSILSVSYKTGFISFSLVSLTRQDQPKFRVDRSKIGDFAGLVIASFVANIIYGIAVMRDLQQIGGILLLSLVNTAFIAYSLVYWILLRERTD